MHRIVLFSAPIEKHFETLYGGLYSGLTADGIIETALTDYQHLYYENKWEGEAGQEFRDKEGWWFDYDRDDWSYDERKYTFTSYSDIPNEFLSSLICLGRVALVSDWAPLRLSDMNRSDYIINKVFYDSLVGSGHLDWKPDVEEEELPF